MHIYKADRRQRGGTLDRSQSLLYFVPLGKEFHSKAGLTKAHRREIHIICILSFEFEPFPSLFSELAGKPRSNIKFGAAFMRNIELIRKVLLFTQFPPPLHTNPTLFTASGGSELIEGNIPRNIKEGGRHITENMKVY